MIKPGPSNKPRKKRPKQRRRAKGEGTFAERANGTWSYALGLGKNEAGKRVRRFVYAPTRAALQRKVADLRASGGGTIQPRAKGTVGEWIEQWLDSDVKPNASPNTHALYETMWRVHAKPLLAGVTLEALDVWHVEHLIAELRRRGTTRAVLHKVSATLGRAIEVAIRRRRYHRANPFRLVEVVAPRPKEVRVLTPAEGRRFLRCADKDEYSALWTVILFGGLRLGEALGLEWRDVDFAHRAVSVRQGLVEVGGHVDVRQPKTHSSARPVELGQSEIEALRRQRARTGRGRFVFTTGTGGHPRWSNLRSRHFEPICRAARIEGLTIHGLRHSMGSLMISKGVPAKVVAERLGHSTTRLTQDRYAHVLPGIQREAVAALEALLAPRKNRDLKK